jgi:TetR/AcrR family transcriptional regulator, cholesterol catabolism regulator
MTRDDILTAAAQIFSEKGFHAASMQDIALAVELQKASLYYHFASKQEILLALLDQALELLIAEMQTVLDEALPPDQKLRRAMVVYLQTMLEHRQLAAVLLLEHRSLDPELQSRHIPRRDRFERLWRDLIQAGTEQGAFDCTDPALATRGLLGVLNWTITWYRPDGELQPETIAGQFANLFLYGLVGCPAPIRPDGLTD